MALRFTSLDEVQLLTCIQHGLYGSNKPNLFKHWRRRDELVVLVEKQVAGLAVVTGSPFSATDRIWDNGRFPERIPIRFVHATRPENRIPVAGEVKDLLTAEWGRRYGWAIVAKMALPEDAADALRARVLNAQNDLPYILDNMDRLIAEARAAR